MFDWPILSTITFAPLIGVALMLFISGDDENARRNIRMIALLTTSFVFLLSLTIWFGFDNANPDFQFVEKAAWLGSEPLVTSATIWVLTVYLCRLLS